LGTRRERFLANDPALRELSAADEFQGAGQDDSDEAVTTLLDRLASLSQSLRRDARVVDLEPKAGRGAACLRIEERLGPHQRVRSGEIGPRPWIASEIRRHAERDRDNQGGETTARRGSLNLYDFIVLTPLRLARNASAT